MVGLYYPQTPRQNRFLNGNHYKPDPPSKKLQMNTLESCAQLGMKVILNIQENSFVKL